MLRTLSVHDFVIVDSLELDFLKGFSALTGETGAGKSILIDALQLAMGARGDAGVIREGASRTDISAEFSANEAARQWLKDSDIDCDDDTVMLRRTVDRTGRSKGFVNGVPVAASQLREISSLLVDIHGQHAHQLLLRPDEQRHLLDRYAGLAPELEELSQRYHEWQDISGKIRQAESDAARLQSDREQLEWKIAELEKLSPKPGEWEQVNSDYDRLSHAASLMETTGQALNELSESDAPIVSRLGAIGTSLSKWTDVDERLAPIVELVEESRIQLQEATYGLRDYLSHADLDPAMLETVGKRLEALHSAGRQFRIQPELLPQELDDCRERLRQYIDLSDIDSLKKQESEASERYSVLAGEVSAKRKDAAKKLSLAVTAIMDDLHMNGGRLSISVETGEKRAYGTDQVEFLVAGHAGASLRPLIKVASGGELARISLAISVVTSRVNETPTLIFDEVDTGIGGAVAEVVGRLLKRIGQDHQVLCVTHLPQVASQAMQHFQVSKVAVGHISHPVSQIVPLDGENRVQEIARMLGGVEMTDATMAHAREMLREGEDTA